MAKLSTESYKGTRDFYPEDQAIQSHMFSAMRKAVESFGYAEYNASILEPTELYLSKANEEIVNEQTYTFTDRGERSVTLRPEMTPTVARLVAARRRELAFPLRWYSIPNVFRYEKPQKGRLREHWQLNVDIFGVPTIDAETEILEVVSAVLKEVGAKENDFVIKVNNRRWLSKIFADLGLSLDQEKAMRLLLDKKDKITDFDEKAKEIIGKPFILPEEKDLEVETLLQSLSKRGIGNVVHDPFLVRGFDYYTGIVFEVFDTNPENRRALFGGGRYDDLTSLFDVETVPAVGFGMGDVTMRDFLEARNLLPKYAGPADLYLCRTSPELSDQVEKIAQQLRSAGLRVATDLTDRKIGDQVRVADRAHIPFVCVIGEEELSSNTFKVKRLSSGEEKTLSLADIPSFIRDNS